MTVAIYYHTSSAEATPLEQKTGEGEYSSSFGLANRARVFEDSEQRGDCQDALNFPPLRSEKLPMFWGARSIVNSNFLEHHPFGCQQLRSWHFSLAKSTSPHLVLLTFCCRILLLPRSDLWDQVRSAFQRDDYLSVDLLYSTKYEARITTKAV